MADPVYTDGSKTEDSAGCAAFTHQGTIKYKLNPNATIFTAELYAVSAALSIIENNNNRKFTIISDSKSALLAVEKPTIDHPLTSAIQTWLLRLAGGRNIVNFCWVSSNINISGNEYADKQAKNAAANRAANMHNNAVPHRDFYSLVKKKVAERMEQYRYYTKAAK